ncbi:hypothetical protein GA0115252_100313 [Streptomyces sp. DfronAA-171]|nr:hypothetical protein GA0115252_100313 [Streptomyces sp. DfronAA-171]
MPPDSITVVTETDELLRRVATRALSESPHLPAPVPEARLAEAEGRLGFPLHPLLARLYREVADGGFGPDYRLLPLLGPDESVVGEYLARREEPGEHPMWPEGIVPVLTWGCAMYAAVDCFDENGQVLLFEPNAYAGGPWDGCWFHDSGSLAAWLGTWLAGTGWYEEDARDGDGAAEPQAWDRAASRLSAEA